MYILLVYAGPPKLLTNLFQQDGPTILNLGTFTEIIRKFGAPTFWLEDTSSKSYYKAMLIHYSHLKHPNIFSRESIRTIPFTNAIQIILVQALKNTTSILKVLLKEVDLWVKFGKFKKFPRIRIETGAEAERFFIYDLFAFVVVGSKAYSFLTCYGEQHLSFLYLLIPFELNLWVGLVVCMVILQLLYKIWMFSSNLWLDHSLKLLLYLLQVLLENGPGLPKYVDR